MLGLTLRAEADGKSAPSSLQQEFCRVSVFYLPGDIVYNVGLQQQVAAWEQVFSDEVLVGPHSHTVTHTQRAQDVQNLKADTRLSVLLLLRPCKKKKSGSLLMQTHTLWFLPCLSRREMMDLMWFSWMMLRTSGLSISTQYSTSRIPAVQEFKSSFLI